MVQFVTDGERPEGTARNLRVVAVSATELEVSWDRPEPQLCHGTIVRYNLGYRLFGQKTPYQFYDLDRYQWSKTRFNFRLRRLEKFTKYEMVVQVRVIFVSSYNVIMQAVNSHGEGPLSDLVLGQTTEAGLFRNFLLGHTGKKEVT